jgi:hypothetical protein
LDQTARAFGVGTIGMAPCCALCARGIAGEHETKDLVVLGPNQRALLGNL